MKSLEHKLIIYDSNCKVCSSLRDVVLKLTSIPDTKVMAFRDLTPNLSQHVDPNRFRNGMAVMDLTGEKTIYGPEGVAHIFSSQYRLVDFLLRFKPFFSLFAFFYKVLAYNRYIIASPKSKFICDCLPDRVVNFRLSYIIIALTISITLTGLFGISLKNFFTGVTSIDAAVQMLLMAGSGWVLQIVVAAIIMKEKALDYIGHLSSIMVVGLLLLVPWMIFYALTGILTPWLPIISVMLSSIFMLYLHMSRVKYLDLSQGWTVGWFFFLQSTAIFWIYFFYLKPLL